eukprot:scaffold24661_cov63-Attheya_sp.AAC.3
MEWLSFLSRNHSERRKGQCCNYLAERIKRGILGPQQDERASNRTNRFFHGSRSDRFATRSETSIAVSPGKDLEKRDGVIDLMEQGGISCGCGLLHRSEEISAEIIAGLRWRTCHTVRSGDR